MAASVSITTDRLLIRDFVEADWRDVRAYAADPEVKRYLDHAPSTEEQTRDFVSRVIRAQADDPRTSFDLAVTVLATADLVGGCALRILSRADELGDIGYIMRRDVWGKGYATEAAQAMIAFGFGDMRLHRIQATCDVGNVASVCVLEKAGMKREGVLHQNKRSPDRWRDSYLYAALAGDWPQST